MKNMILPRRQFPETSTLTFVLDTITRICLLLAYAFTLAPFLALVNLLLYAFGRNHFFLTPEESLGGVLVAFPALVCVGLLLILSDTLAYRSFCLDLKRKRR